MAKRPSLATNMKAMEERTAPDPVALVASRSERPAEPKKYHAATRSGMKRLLIPVEPATHKQLKLLAIQQETTLEALTRAALDAYLKNAAN